MDPFLLKEAELHILTGGMGAGKSTLARRLAQQYDYVTGTDTGKPVNGQYVQPSKEEKARIRAEKNTDVLERSARGEKVLVEGFHSMQEHHAPLIAAADKILEMDVGRLTRGISVAKRSFERGTPVIPDIKRYIQELPHEAKHREAFMAHARPGTPVVPIGRDGKMGEPKPVPERPVTGEKGTTKISSEMPFVAPSWFEPMRADHRSSEHSLQEVMETLLPELSSVKSADMQPHIKMQDHQKDAIEKARETSGLWLLHGLGSGKTILSQAIAEDRGGKVLVVVPASLRNNYREQLAGAVSKDRLKDYHIVSYDALRTNPTLVDELKPNTMICDEFHRLRNAGANRDAVEAARAKVPFMVGLSGSLVSNHPSEIVPLINLVAGKRVFQSIEQFNRDYIGEKTVPVSTWERMRGVQPGVVTVGKNLQRFASQIHPYIHRFSGSPEWKKNMPRVREEIVRVPMNPEQERLYNEMLAADEGLSRKIRENLPPSKQESKSMTAFLTGLRQVLNAPETMHVGLSERHNPKLQAIADNIAKDHAADPHHKSIVYSNFIDSGVQPIIKKLTEQHGVPAQTFTGALNDKEKGEVVEAYNRGDLRVMGVSPAGAEGLDLKKTLQAHVLDPHWNPERANQFIGRAARFKSHEGLPPEKQEVVVKRYLAVHNEPRGLAKLLGKKAPTSADEWIHERAMEKERLNKQFKNAIPHFDEPAPPPHVEPVRGATARRPPATSDAPVRHSPGLGMPKEANTLTNALQRVRTGFLGSGMPQQITNLGHLASTAPQNLPEYLVSKGVETASHHAGTALQTRGQALMTQSLTQRPYSTVMLRDGYGKLGPVKIPTNNPSAGAQMWRQGQSMRNAGTTLQRHAAPIGDLVGGAAAA